MQLLKNIFIYVDKQMLIALIKILFKYIKYKNNNIIYS